VVAFAPAGIGAGMAYRPQRLGLDEQGIIVAITQYFFNEQEIAALLSFCPQPFFAAAVKRDLAAP